uniref:Uncharacterized protein n=1 Tax=Nelumbo nucifera TaxID=4432 RepID=A0A822YXX2_NELNU|nr:TPA_asm: hypothetical protein HUJ06_006789 [Nelumbo nucifera]
MGPSKVAFLLWTAISGKYLNRNDLERSNSSLSSVIYVFCGEESEMEDL